MNRECRKNDYQTLETSPLMNSTSSRSRLDKLTSGRISPAFPDTEMHLGMILGMNANENPESVGDAKSRVLVNQSQLQNLRDHLTVMQKRNAALITENKFLSGRLKLASESKSSGMEKVETTLNVHCSSSQTEIIEKQKKILEDRGISTADFLVTTERGIQEWAVCRACEKNLEGQDNIGEATVIVTKSELESLEKDMRALREAVVIRESDWSSAIEREECYREQLTRSASEAMTARQLSESRYGELERLAQTLAETEKELRSAQKEILGLKKIINKQDKQRKVGEKCNVGDNAQTRYINEKEQRWIEDIVGQLANAKNKHKSKLIEDKVLHSSGTNFNVNQTSPRTAAVSVDSSMTSPEEPVTVTEMLNLTKE